MPKIHKDRPPTDRSDVAEPVGKPAGVTLKAESTTVGEAGDTPRRRGRPKGSRNKPKPNVVAVQAGAAKGSGAVHG